MEKLIETLKKGISTLDTKSPGRFNLSDAVLDSLYSVYPFHYYPIDGIDSFLLVSLMIS